MSACILTSVAAARSEFRVSVAVSKAEIAEAFRLRHQVYCVERGYEHSDNGLETDAFDANARHVLLSHRTSGAVVGTVRVVLPQHGRHAASFPMQTVCEPALWRGTPLWSTGEISRFAISKDRRTQSGTAGVFMRLGLMQGIVQVSRDAGLTHWCAVMERSLLRLLQGTGIHFRPVGGLVAFHGIRQPTLGAIDEVLARIRAECRPVWDYITVDGTLVPDAAEALLAA